MDLSAGGGTRSGDVLDLDFIVYTGNPNSERLTNKPMTTSCFAVDLEKQMVLRARRLVPVRNVRCFRAICYVSRLPGLWPSGARARTYPQKPCCGLAASGVRN
jgi:hypothetical protein